jgi:hypothetical protein
MMVLSAFISISLEMTCHRQFDFVQFNVEKHYQTKNYTTKGEAK